MNEARKRYQNLRKDVVRQKIATPGKVYKHVLDLPASPCLSIEHLCDNRHVSTSTKFVTIERKRTENERIKSKFKSWGLSSRSIHFFGELVDCTHRGPYDLVNLDTCNSLGEKLLEWVGELTFLPGGELNIWVTAPRSQSEWDQTLYTTFLESVAGLKVLSHLERESPDLFRNAPVYEKVCVCGILCSLHKYTFDVAEMLDYTSNTMKMYFFRFVNARHTSQFPNLQAIIEEGKGIGLPSNQARASTILNGHIVQMCGQAVTLGGPGYRAFAVRKMRNAIREGVLEGKDPKWIKAGWKSFASRFFNNEEFIEEVHELISGV